METLKCIVYASASSMPMTEEALEGLLIEARALDAESREAAGFELLQQFWSNTR